MCVSLCLYLSKYNGENKDQQIIVYWFVNLNKNVK